MPSKSLASRVFANWPAKVLSLFAAGFLFFFYQLNRLENRYLSAPLEISMNDEFVPSTQYPRSVRLTLRGEANDLFRIQEGDLTASLDLSSCRAEGVFRAPVSVEKRGSALGIDPLEIVVEPADVALSMERRVSRVVPIMPSFRGFLEPGYELVSFTLTPPQVEIFGPASAVAEIADAPTDFIELSGRSADFSVKTRLLKKEGLVLVAGPDIVGFEAVVQKSLALMSFESVRIEAEGLPAGLDLVGDLPLGRLRVRALRPEAAAYEPGAGDLVADLSGARLPGAYSAPVRVRALEGLLVEAFEPRQVEVVLKAAEPAPDTEARR